MYHEWVSPAANANTKTEFLEFVNNFHSNIIIEGTGITHMSELAGQFNLVNEGLKGSSYDAISFYPPLYYTYMNGTKKFYLTFIFGTQRYGSSYLSIIYCKVGVSFTIDSLGKPINNVWYYDILSAKTMFNMVMSQVPYYCYNKTPYTPSKSIIINNNDTLVIMFAYNSYNGESLDIKKPIVSLILQVNDNSTTQIGFYTLGEFTSSSSSSSSSRVPQISTFYNTSYIMINTNSLIIDPKNNFIPLYYYNEDGFVDNMSNVFYYNNINMPQAGFIDIGDSKLWLSGKNIEVYNVSGNSSNNYSLAFKVN